VLAGDTPLHCQIIGQIHLGEDITRGVTASQPDWLHQKYLQFPFLSTFANDQPNAQWPNSGQIRIVALRIAHPAHPVDSGYLDGLGLNLLRIQEIRPAFGTVYGVGYVDSLANLAPNHSESPYLGVGRKQLFSFVRK
jgi:hypothetical protein